MEVSGIAWTEHRSDEPFPVGEIRIVNHVDREGRPLGGSVNGAGLDIAWQSGPTRKVKQDGTVYYARQGAFVEDVLIAARTRLEFYQRSEFACEANEKAIANIDAALDALDARRVDRVERGVYGVNEQ